MGTRKDINGEQLTLEECYEKHGALIRVAMNKIPVTKTMSVQDREDVHSVGIEGFIKAYNRFESSKGYRFSTYAVTTVWGIMMQYINRSGVIRPSRRLSDLKTKVSKDMYIKTWKEIQEEYELSDEEILMLYEGTKSTYSMDYQLEVEDGETTTLGEEMGEEDDLTVLRVKEFKGILTDVERQIVNGLEQGLIQKEIAEAVGLGSQTQVHRTIKKIQNKYREWEKIG